RLRRQGAPHLGRSDSGRRAGALPPDRAHCRAARAGRVAEAPARALRRRDERHPDQGDVLPPRRGRPAGSHDDVHRRQDPRRSHRSDGARADRGEQPRRVHEADVRHAEVRRRDSGQQVQRAGPETIMSRRGTGLILRIAWRNLGRNRRRTLITGAGIALGAAMCIGAIGILDGLDRQIVTSITDTELGHVQVHAPGYLRSRALRDAFDPAGLVPAIEGVPHVAGVAPRIYGWGFAAKATQSAGVQLMGVDPARERAVTSLLAGAALPAAPTPWQRARPLTAEQQAKDAALTKAA